MIGRRCRKLLFATQVITATWRSWPHGAAGMARRPAFRRVVRRNPIPRPQSQAAPSPAQCSPRRPKSIRRGQCGCHCLGYCSRRRCFEAACRRGHQLGAVDGDRAGAGQLPDYGAVGDSRNSCSRSGRCIRRRRVPASIAAYRLGTRQRRSRQPRLVMCWKWLRGWMVHRSASGGSTPRSISTCSTEPSRCRVQGQPVSESTRSIRWFFQSTSATR